MKCGEIKRFAHAYIDGEFDASERALLEEHLTQCPSCREDVQGLAAFQRALQKRAAQPPMSSEAKSRLLGRVRSQLQQPARKRFQFPLAAAASLVVLLGAFFLYQGWQAPDQLAQIVDESIAAHEASLPPEAKGSNEEIQGYLARHGELIAEPPLKESDKTRLVGVRLTRIGKSKALLYRYLHQGRDISVVQLPKRLPASGDLPRPGQDTLSRVVYTGARNGHAVTTFESTNNTNTVIGDIPEPELLKLVPASL